MNKYYGTITMPHAYINLAEKELYQTQEINVVEATVEAENLKQRRARWVMLTATHVPLFPRLTIEYLRELIYRTYQINFSQAYIQDTSLRAEQEDEEEGECGG